MNETDSARLWDGGLRVCDCCVAVGQLRWAVTSTGKAFSLQTNGSRPDVKYACEHLVYVYTCVSEASVT